MNFEEYRRQSARTRSPFLDAKYPKLMQAVMGLNSEAGEIAGLLEKIVFQGHEFDLEKREKLMKEIGDLVWYLALLLDEADMSLEDVMIQNILKLKKRFPEKFTAENSMRRSDADYG